MSYWTHYFKDKQNDWHYIARLRYYVPTSVLLTIIDL